MPKLNNIQVADRLRKRIAELDDGKEIAAKDIRALLTDEQMTRLDATWKQQEQLRKGKRAATEEQKRALGWKTKREVRLEIFKQALEELDGNQAETLEDLQHKARVRQSRIYLDSYFEEREKGADKFQAAGRANNALTRAGLARIDGVSVNQISKRDKEIHEMEDRLKKQIGLDGDKEEEN